MTTKREIFTSPAVRIRPPSNIIGSGWSIDDYLGRRRFKVPPAAVLLVISCLQKQNRTDVIYDVSQRLQLTVETVESLARVMENKQILLSESSERLNWFNSIRTKWSKYGWDEAAYYFLGTFDYPFVDYTTAGGFETDRSRMASYFNEEPEIPREKLYTKPIDIISTFLPSAELLKVPFTNLLNNNSKAKLVDLEAVKKIASMAFGTVREVPRSPTDSNPLLFKTSPSGGSRHPTEGYIFSVNVKDMESGWFHCTSKKPSLELIQKGVHSSELDDFFFGISHRAPFEIAAIIVLTSLFERNMYRYREPRTFRSVHLDVGHIIATIEMIARSLDIRSYVQFAVNDTYIEEKLGINGAEEGLMGVVALG